MFWVADRINNKVILHSFEHENFAYEIYESGKLGHWQGVIKGSVLLSDMTPIAAWGKHPTQEEISCLLQPLLELSDLPS